MTSGWILYWLCNCDHTCRKNLGYGSL